MSICDGSSGSDLKVEYSTDPSLSWNDAGHTWNTIDNVTGTLDVTGGEKTASIKQTHGTAAIGISKAGLLNISLDVVFENSTSSFLAYLRDLWDETVANPCYFLRWSYDNGSTDSVRYTAKVTPLTPPYTGGDPASGDPVSKVINHAVDANTIYDDTVP